MRVIRTINEINKLKKQLSNKRETIGFVPTMGSLHEGHLTLIKEAKDESDIVIMSIFVNPLQFGENEDFDSYPRDEEKDLDLAEKHGVDYVFIPSVNEMYPEPLGISMGINKRVGVLCDRNRPGHFQGVLTVLTKLFHLVQPNFVYFGMKDAQQVAIVDLLIEELNFPLQLRMVSTVREESGLAKSSRNIRLSNNERSEASFLYQALKMGKERALEGERSTDKLISHIREYLNEHVSGKIEYIEILSFPDLKEMTTIEGQVIFALAVQFKKARLIDNIVFDLNRIEERQ